MDAFVAKFDPAQSGPASLTYSTYLGGNISELGRGIAVDTAGNAYVTGSTFSDDFPTLNPARPTHPGTVAAYVTSLNSTGTALRYSTRLGGAPHVSEGHAIAVDVAGNAYVAGYTQSPAGNTGTVIPFPVTPGAFQSLAISASATVTKLDAAGALLLLDVLGSATGSGETSAESIGINEAGQVYVTGYTRAPRFPVTADAFQPVLRPGAPYFNDAFVAKVDPSPTGAISLIYSTYLGSSGSEFNNAMLTIYGLAGIAVNAAGTAYVTGGTQGPDFPVTPSAYQSAYAGWIDAYVAKIVPTPACSAIPGTWTPTGETCRSGSRGTPPPVSPMARCW